MSLASLCESIAAIGKDTTFTQLSEIAAECEAHLDGVAEILDAVENTLSSSANGQRLMLWLFVDRLAKQNTIFLDALRPKMIALATHEAPRPRDAEWDDFVALMKTSFAVLFGAPMVSLVLLQLSDRSGGSAPHTASLVASSLPLSSAADSSSGDRTQTALALHSTALRRTGAFITKAVAVERDASVKHTLKVKTLDSQMAINVSSSYAPARPVELYVPEMQADADAARGYMKALPADYFKNYREARRARLREVMQKNREEQDRRQQEEFLKKVRLDTSDARGAALGEKDDDDAKKKGEGASQALADIVMPVELPRDEHGVKRGNFPLGVRFIRDCIAACGGAVELAVVVNRITTLANREVVAEFGDVREFLTIHSPTFRLEMEQGQWVVRLMKHAGGFDGGSTEPTWQAMACPLCCKVVKGRNYARHKDCRSCITAQLALGLQGDYQGRGPIAELAFMAKQIISHRDTFDDGDVDLLAESLTQAANVRRFRLASPRQFVPIFKAMRVVRDRWLKAKGVTEVADVVVNTADSSVVNLFLVFGRSIHRLPIAWIETGDVIDMCSRFTDGVLPPFNPPPRPADPRISLDNEYPGFLLCESELDDEDDPSVDEDEFSDDEGPAFTFAAPVDVAETLFTAGFPRDTKRLQHRMRTAPPMVLQRVLKGDRTQTQHEMYADVQRDNLKAAVPSGKLQVV